LQLQQANVPDYVLASLGGAKSLPKEGFIDSKGVARTSDLASFRFIRLG
jgi:hypothetical protein